MQGREAKAKLWSCPGSVSLQLVLMGKGGWKAKSSQTGLKGRANPGSGGPRTVSARERGEIHAPLSHFSFL